MQCFSLPSNQRGRTGNSCVLVCVCVCVCVYVYVHVCMCMHTHVQYYTCVFLTLSSLKTATAVERIFPFIPENRYSGAGINTPFLPADRCSGSAIEIRTYLTHGQQVSSPWPV